MKLSLLTLTLLVLIAFAIYRSLSIIFILIANKKYTAEDTAEALRWYKKACTLKYSSPNTKTSYAYILLGQGHIDEAEKILKEVLNGKTNINIRMNAVLNLSLVLWKKGNLDQAIEVLQELYNSNLKNSVLYQNLGYYLILKGDYTKSLDFNLEAYDYNKDDPSILDNLAMNYYFMESYDKALELYLKLIPLNPKFPTAYYFYAKTLIQQEKYKEALEALNTALNCRFSFITAIKKDDIEKEINYIKNLQ